MCEQLPAIAQQKLLLLVRVALKSMAPPTPTSSTPPSGDASSQDGAQVQDGVRAVGEGVVNKEREREIKGLGGRGDELKGLGRRRGGGGGCGGVCGGVGGCMCGIFSSFAAAFCRSPARRRFPNP
jgi:hypothetical protein